MPCGKGSAGIVSLAVVATAGALSVFTAAVSARNLLTFDQVAGPSGTAPAEWPAGTSLKRPINRQELLLFVHPLCSCTVATLNEIAGIAGRTQTILPGITVLFAPSGVPDEANTLREQVRRLPGVVILRDESGREAKNFGALTSGYTLLYDSRGRLLFHGGVTGSRGHVGKNYGADRLAAAIDSNRPSIPKTLVFGCSLFRSEARL